MKMGDGGFRPAVNVRFDRLTALSEVEGQLAADTESRAILRKLRTGVDVTAEGVDYEPTRKRVPRPMRKQVEDRTGQKVQEHWYDGGYVKTDAIERADEQGVTVYAPTRKRVPGPPKNKQQRGDEFVPRPGDSEAIIRWRMRMGSDEGKEIYKQRASTIETINTRMRRSGLVPLTVRGLKKAKCVALGSALAYNLMLFARQLTS